MSSDKYIRPADDRLINMIQSGGSDGRKAIEIIYRNEELKTKIQMLISRRGGDEEDFRDVFHEGIIALQRNIRNGAFNEETSIDGYLFSICRNVWNNLWRKKSRMSNNELEAADIPSDHTPESQLFQKEKVEVLERILSLIDEQCQKILTLWKASYSMKEIAALCQLSSEKLAKKYRYRCMKKLNEKLKEQYHLIEALRHV